MVVVNFCDEFKTIFVLHVQLVTVDVAEKDVLCMIMMIQGLHIQYLQVFESNNHKKVLFSRYYKSDRFCSNFSNLMLSM